MAITVSRSSISFGSVTTQSKVQEEVTVSNSASQAVDVFISLQGSGTAAYAVSPAAQVTIAGKGSLTITVFFEPAEEQSYPATLKIDPTGASVTNVTLSGQGATPSGWQQQAGSYLLVKVPDYGDGTFETRDGPVSQVTMTSYLRLGTFDWSQESALAKKLLKLLPQTGIAGNPDRGDAKHYPDFDFDADVNSFEDMPPVKLVTEGKSATTTGNREVFFIDDVRTRAQDHTGLGVADDPGHGLTQAQRQLESARLYSRGGWRDHSDGNRLSTTYGDKVEIIRGNYRLLVMGRQEDPGEGMGWELSGSSLLDYAPGMMPGAAVFVEWVPDYKMTGDAQGVWLMANTTQNVYMYDRNAGNFREEVWGDVHESYTGSENPPSGAPGTEAGRFGSSASSGPGGFPAGHEPPVKIPGLNYDLPRTAGDRHTPPWDGDNTGVVRSNPHLIEKTWARRIDSWTGSEACPVPEISEKKWATTTEECNYVTTSTTTEVIGTQTEVKTIGVSASVETIGTKNEVTTAGSIVECTTASTILLETTVAPVHVEVEGSNHVELEGGVGHVEVSIGLHFALEIAAALEITLGASYEIKLGKHGEFKTKTERLALSRATASLERAATVLKDSTIGVDLKHTALAHALTALKVNLGV